jgi:glutamate-1-semialdehyde 2,1-aminomutase
LGLGGAQKKFGIIPDLTTLGKIAGGGFNIGIVGGKANIMEICSPTYSEKNKVLIGGGTFSATPYSMRAGAKIVDYLEKNSNSIYKELEKKGDYVRRTITEFIDKNNINAIVTGTSSLYMIHFPLKQGMEIKSPQDIGSKTDIFKRENEFKVRLLNKGIHVMHGGGAISLAHGDDEIDYIIKTTCEVLCDMEK